MKGTTRIIIFCGLFCATCFAGQIVANRAKPFAQMSKVASAQWGGWDGKQSVLYKLFLAEKKHLGDNFEKELLRFVDDDALRHEKMAFYLIWDDLDNQSEPSKTAMLLLMQGMTLCRNSKDTKVPYRLVTLNVLAAIQSHRLGFPWLARAYKKDAEGRISHDRKLAGAFPSLPEKLLDQYDTIDESVTNQAEKKGRSGGTGRQSTFGKEASESTNSLAVRQTGDE